MHLNPNLPTSPRLRIQAFGALRIERDGVLLAAAGKAQRKPLDLLALIVALAGKPLPVSAAIDELWPSLDANAPRASLDMAVARLRRWLDVPGAVLLAEGRLSLHPTLVWTDVAAFDAERQRAAHGDLDAALRAIALYDDALLGAEAVSGRLLVQRQRLQQAFSLLALDSGRQLQAEARHDAACRLLHDAIGRDPLCEPLYRALMAAQLASGERAEALRTYQRCRSLLQTLLGLLPSLATKALADEAQCGTQAFAAA